MASPQLFFDEEAGRNYDACDMCLTRALLHPLSILIRQGDASACEPPTANQRRLLFVNYIIGTGRQAD
jgi:hypothetical protein